MFEVTGIRPGLIWYTVELTALDEIAGSKQLFTGRSMNLVQCPYRFEKGCKLTIKLLRWKRCNAGDRLEASTVLGVPSVLRAVCPEVAKYI